MFVTCKCINSKATTIRQKLKKQMTMKNSIVKGHITLDKLQEART